MTDQIKLPIPWRSALPRQFRKVAFLVDSLFPLVTFLLPTAETFARDLPTKWKIKFWADGQLGAPKVNMWRPGALWCTRALLGAPRLGLGAPRCSQVGPEGLNLGCFQKGDFGGSSQVGVMCSQVLRPLWEHLGWVLPSAPALWEHPGPGVLPKGCSEGRSP